MAADARAAIYGAAWLPGFTLFVFSVPTFEHLFSRLRERGELPALLFFVLLVVGDIGVANVLQGSVRSWRDWIWFGGVVVLGIVAAAIVTSRFSVHSFAPIPLPIFLSKVFGTKEWGQRNFRTSDSLSVATPS